jgi:uncharacterized surface protein with fasciclin (FAS1) repeats
MANSNKTAGIVGIVLLAVVVGGALLLFNGNSDNETASATQPATSTSQAEQSSDMTQKTTIVDAAAANPDFSTLVTAVKAADLVTALSGDAKLTVFAPTNAAFNKLPAGTVETLVQPANKETLKGILTYHVVEGEVLSSQLTNGQVVKTLNGGSLTVTIENGSVYLTDAKGGRSMVTQADMKVDNGVIHAIDTVVMPS